jgi:hypothetical protein
MMWKSDYFLLQKHTFVTVYTQITIVVCYYLSPRAEARTSFVLYPKTVAMEWAAFMWTNQNAYKSHKEGVVGWKAASASLLGKLQTYSCFYWTVMIGGGGGHYRCRHY